MSGSSVPQLQFSPVGPILPQGAAVLAGVQADMNAAFGGGLNLGLSTPQGQLASSLSAVIEDSNANIAYFAAMVDPQFSSGCYQDALGRIYFMTRNPATATAVTCTITGLLGTILPSNTLAKDASDNIYQLTAQATIPGTGSMSVVFQNIQTGPIPCAGSTLTQVYQAITGWDTITNPSAGELGQDVESRAAFEWRRQNSVAANALGSLAAILGAVFEVSGVLDAYATENTSSSPVTVGATQYSLVAHSLYVAVVGGVDADVAQAIWSKKDVGCGYNGDTSVTVEASGYSGLPPSYVVKFERPDPLTIKFAVTLVNDPRLPASIVTMVENAIVAQFSGQTPVNRERIGSNIYANNYMGAMYALSPFVRVVSLLIGTSTATLETVSIGIDQYPTIDSANIAVTLS